MCEALWELRETLPEPLCRLPKVAFPMGGFQASSDLPLCSCRETQKPTKILVC